VGARGDGRDGGKDDVEERPEAAGDAAQAEAVLPAQASSSASSTRRRVLELAAAARDQAVQPVRKKNAIGYV
jgi:hypothetical protein